MRTSRLQRAALALALGVSFAIAASHDASARQVEDVYSGQILICPKGFPREITSTDDFVAYIKKNAVDWLDENKDTSGNETGAWQLRYMGFFAQALNDPSIEVKFYDVTGGDNQFITSFDLDTEDLGQRILASTITVSKDDGFVPNHKYEMTIEDKGRVIASAVVTLVGQGPHYSGTVSFSDSDASSSQP
jgi:hypothetical protein